MVTLPLFCPERLGTQESKGKDFSLARSRIVVLQGHTEFPELSRKVRKFKGKGSNCILHPNLDSLMNSFDKGEYLRCNRICVNHVATMEALYGVAVQLSWFAAIENYHHCPSSKYQAH
jgi:hypothetical protein